jgi:lysozyme family protein
MHENPDRLVSAAHDDWRGVDREIRHLQSLLGVEPDGFIGPLTRAAAAKRGGEDTGSTREILAALETLKGDLMATKQETLDALAALGSKIDDWMATEAAANAAAIQKLLDEQKAKLTAEDATMDASDFDDIAAAIMGVANKVPAKFDPSGNG